MFSHYTCGSVGDLVYSLSPCLLGRPLTPLHIKIDLGYSKINVGLVKINFANIPLFFFNAAKRVT